MRRSPSAGFTLIELMLVVAIIGILATIAIPQFATLVARAEEGRTKGNLGTVRSALSIYFADTEGMLPVDDLHSLTASDKYLHVMPSAVIPMVNGLNTGHPSSNVVYTMASNVSDVDVGGWGYQNDPLATETHSGFSTPPWGSIMVNCAHQDSRGTIWFMQ